MRTPDFARFAADPATRLLTWAAARQVADMLAAGIPAVLPTDTGYMLSVPALDTAAVENMFEVKQRSRSAPVSVACASPAMATRYGRFEGLAGRGLEELLPGPVTLVVPAQPGFTTDLALLDGTVGVRIPGCAATLQVIAELDQPVTATSLNPSGSEPIRDPSDEALGALAWGADKVVVVEDERAQVFDRASTLVRLAGEEPEVLRQGPVTEGEIRARLDRPSRDHKRGH